MGKAIKIAKHAEISQLGDDLTHSCHTQTILEYGTKLSSDLLLYNFLYSILIEKITISLHKIM